MILTVLAMDGTQIVGRRAGQMQGSGNRRWPALLAYSDLHLYLGFRFASAFWSGRATLDSPGLRSLDMVSRNPFLVIRLQSCCHGRAVGTGGWDALVSSALLDRTALSTLAASAFLGEVGRDPDVVEEIDYADEAR